MKVFLLTVLMVKRRVHNLFDASKALAAAILEKSSMLSHLVRRITLDMRRIHRTHKLTTHHASRIDQIASPLELSEDMHPSQTYLHLLPPRLRLLLSLVVLAGLTGCGPASSDNAPNLESRASVSGPSLSKQSASPSNNSSTPATQASSPVPLASSNGTGSASGMGAVPGVGSSHAVSVLSSQPEHPVEGLVVPELMVQKLNSPIVRVRLRALEAWAQTAPPGAVDPFILAFEDKDERVRALAQQLIEQDWARKAEEEK